MVDIKELKDEQLKKANGGAGSGEPLYSVGQKVCVLNNIIAEITSIIEKGPLDTIYTYKSLVLGYTENCSEHTKYSFPIGKNYSFFENEVTSVIS